METEEADFYPMEMKVEGTAPATLEQHTMGEMNCLSIQVERRSMEGRDAVKRDKQSRGHGMSAGAFRRM